MLKNDFFKGCRDLDRDTTPVSREHPTPPTSIPRFFHVPSRQVWSPNLEAALYNRSVRLLIHCNNQVNYEEGYVLFKVGDEAFQESCVDQPTLCVGSESGDDDGDDSSSASPRHTGFGVSSAGVLAVAVGAVSAMILDLSY